MRILLLNWRDIRHPAAGGAEVWAHRVAEELIALGHEVTFFCAAVKSAPEEEVMNGVRIVRRGSRIGVYGAAKRFYSENRASFDVVLEEINTRPFFSFTWPDAVSVPMIHQVAKEVWRYEAPFPVSVIGRYFLEPRWLKKLASVRVMTLSPSSAESLREYGLRDLVVVLPGSDDTEVRPGPKETTPTVCFLGRLVKSKRPDDAVEAFSRLRKIFPEARFWMMGDGAMRNSLAKLNQPGVELLGHVPNDVRADRVSRSHVLVTTTVREGWGLNVSEASAMGTPTIGYSSPGLRDSIPMSGGHVVTENPEALGDALIAFFQGRLNLTPKIATQEWSSVARQIEGELQNALSRLRG